MNKLILFAVLLCLVAVNARRYGDRETSETLAEEDESQIEFRKEKQHTTQPRHRRRRWQSYGYDYQPPQYYPNRRDSYYNNQDLMPEILRLLEEISVYVKKSQQPPPPPPPPQPIYVPYPVPYFVPRYISCKSDVPKINITRRFPELDDVNRNWGFVTNDLPEDIYDDSDGTRPISFDPIKPKQNNLKRPAPAVEHGSEQSKNSFTTQAPVFDEIPASVSNNLPSMCNAAILSCCSINEDVQRKQCFTEVGCGKTYSKGGACTSNSIKDALDSIKSTYSPVN